MSNPKENKDKKTPKFVINRLDLGSRELGWELYDGHQVIELTSRQLKEEILSDNIICGLYIAEDGELDLDREGFFTTNMMIHSHINQYKPMITDNCIANLMYVVIGSHKEDNKEVYDLVSSRMARETFDSNKLKAFLDFGMISGGIRLNGNKLELAPILRENTIE